MVVVSKVVDVAAVAAVVAVSRISTFCFEYSNLFFLKKVVAVVVPEVVLNQKVVVKRVVMSFLNLTVIVVFSSLKERNIYLSLRT